MPLTSSGTEFVKKLFSVEELCNFCLVDIRADNAKAACSCSTAVTNVRCTRNIIVMNPLTVSTSNNALCTENLTVSAFIFEGFQSRLNFFNSVLSGSFLAPAGKDFISMMVMMFMFIVVMMMVMFMLFVLVVVMVMMMMLFVFMFVMVMMVVMMVMFLFFFEKCFQFIIQCIFLRHGSSQLFAGKFVPFSGNNRRSGILFTQTLYTVV